MPRVHHLKCWPEPFAALKSGLKPFEIRKDDRGFMVGDFLLLREWEPSTFDDPADEPGYTDDELWFKITYKTPGGSWGLPRDLCVLGVVPCEEPKE